jgi:tryptophan-rich sensory protein
MKARLLLKFFVAVSVSLLAGAIGAIYTSTAIPTWYMTLPKPLLSPPGWVFMPVWTTLYVLMGLAAFLVWRKGIEQKDVRAALDAFGFQLVLNAAWSVFFFGLRSPLLGLIDIAALWLAVVATIIAFRRVSRPAAWLLAPYLAWVSFASYLNLSIWLMTRSAG